MSDYRNTIYCKDLAGVQERKKLIEKEILDEHPGEVDMYKYVHPNKEKYKDEFMVAYNCKCAYCGVSALLIPKEFFEIDHYIYKKSEHYDSEAEAGEMDNIVLSCRICNNRKRAFDIPDKYLNKLHPDKKGITEQFFRDNDYSIGVVNKSDTTIVSFYKKLGLGEELKRLDYLIMNIEGLKGVLYSMENMSEVYMKIDRMERKLIEKRNGFKLEGFDSSVMVSEEKSKE